MAQLTIRKILISARRILLDGGDPKPCALGSFCVYCCIAIAKGDLEETEEYGLNAEVRGRQWVDGLSAMMTGMRPEIISEGDEALDGARTILQALCGDEVQTKDTAIAVIDKAIACCDISARSLRKAGKL